MTAPSASPVRGRVPRALATGLVLALPAAVLFGLSWSAGGAEAAALESARAGVEYVRPVGTVVAVLADSRAAVATGAPFDTAALRRAVDEVDRVDAEQGGPLGVSGRWAEVRDRALALADRPSADPDPAGEVSVLSRELAGAAGESSGMLREEPALGELTGSVLPALLSATADQVVAVAAVREDDPESVGRAAAAGERVRGAVADVDDLLARLSDGTAAVTAAEEALLVRAGDVRAAVAPLVPVGAVVVADPGRVRSAQEVLVRSGGELHRTALDVLAERTGSRLSAVELRRTGLGAAGLLALVVAGAVAWTALGRRPEPVDQGGHGEYEGAPDGWSEPRSREVVMVDARSLLGADGDAEEVVRVGRSVRRKWESEDEPA